MSDTKATTKTEVYSAPKSAEGPVLAPSGDAAQTSPTTVAHMISPLAREISLQAGLRQALFWAVMFGAGECYFSLFATYLKAPQFFFGLMVGIPSLLGPLSQVAGAVAVERTGSRKRLVMLANLAQTMCFAPLILLPYYMRGTLGHVVLLLAVIAYFLASNFSGPPWNSLISVLVPAAQRNEYFARQARGVGAVSLAIKLIVGVALFLAGLAALPSRGEDLAGRIYTASFILAAVALHLCFRQLRRVTEPPFEHKPADSFTFWQFLRRAPESNFVKFALFVGLVQFGAQVAGPYFVPYAVYTLGFKQWEWVLLESSAALASICTLLFWGRFSKRFGNKKTLKYTTFGVAVIPVLWALCTNYPFLIVVNAFSGFAWAGFNLSFFNYILEAVSPPKRARCLAYFSIVVGFSMFAGSMFGGWLGAALPHTLAFGFWTMHVQSTFTYLLLLSGLLRFFGWLFLLPMFRELSVVEPFSLRKWIFYIAETRLPVGLSFNANVEPNGGNGNGNGNGG